MGKGDTAANGTVLTAQHLAMTFGERRVLDDISLDVVRGEVLAIVGGSGSGKSTLMRLLALLMPPTAGTVRVLDTDIEGPDDPNILSVRRRAGVMFQHGALFGDMTVLENVCVPLREHTELSPGLVEQLGMLKIALAGLQPDAAALYPSQLSGGMKKRAAVARGIALDPELLFLDEPGSGLDPVSADAMDELILELKSTMDLTVILVTHDMDSLWRVADRILLLADAKIAAFGTPRELLESEHEVARQFFHGRRGHAAGAAGHA